MHLFETSIRRALAALGHCPNQVPTVLSALISLMISLLTDLSSSGPLSSDYAIDRHFFDFCENASEIRGEYNANLIKIIDVN